MLGREEQKNTSTSKETTITLSEDEFTCPISGQIFLYPVMTHPCGHLFEEESINAWQNKNEDKEKTTCPNCSEHINGFFPAPPFFNSAFNQFLKENPSLQDERYFNLQSFSSCLLDEKRNPDKLKKMINLLKNSEKQMNTALDETGRCITAACCLVATDYGLNLLLRDEALRNKIQSDGLNSINEEKKYRGISAAYLLTRTEKGRQLLSTDARLRAMLTKETLNAVVETEGSEKGKSAAYWLINTPEGLRLLKQDPDLRDKIGFKEQKDAKVPAQHVVFKRLSEIFSNYKSSQQGHVDIFTFLKKR
jgi:hypothetical protein